MEEENEIKFYFSQKMKKIGKCSFLTKRKMKNFEFYFSNSGSTFTLGEVEHSFSPCSEEITISWQKQPSLLIEGSGNQSIRMNFSKLADFLDLIRYLQSFQISDINLSRDRKTVYPNFSENIIISFISKDPWDTQVDSMNYSEFMQYLENKIVERMDEPNNYSVDHRIAMLKEHLAKLSESL